MPEKKEGKEISRVSWGKEDFGNVCKAKVHMCQILAFNTEMGECNND